MKLGERPSRLIVVAPGVKIGKHCELGWAQLYGRDVAAKTVFDVRYPEPIVVYAE